jgi:hypothetical protein
MHVGVREILTSKVQVEAQEETKNELTVMKARSRGSRGEGWERAKEGRRRFEIETGGKFTRSAQAI